eukprot:SAG31_NODE_15748_length_740_cov_1.195008_1_plen_125_part_00
MPASMALTDRQREDIRSRGFTVMESFFQGEELQGLVAGLERSIQKKELGAGNAPVHDVFLELVDHPRILPYVVDLLGYNIQLRDALFGPVPPRACQATPDRLRSAWHFDQEEGKGLLSRFCAHY